MSRTLQVLALLIALSACTVQERSHAFATTAAATGVRAVHQRDQVASLFIAPAISGLDAPFQYSLGGTFECTATITAGPALEAAITDVTKSAFADVRLGGGLAEPLPGAARHISVQLDSLSLAPAELHSRMFSAHAVADADLRLRVSVYDAAGKLLLRVPLSASGHGEMKELGMGDRPCAVAGQVHAMAIEDAIRKVMQDYVGRVLDSTAVALAADDRRAVPGS